ncbi:MAG: hypothetical protein C5B49_11065 [Bdellovibrio sp.]|nr:MAG: hypothetical protein C5B49_11065 [Bdellovibrio sp.]
MDKNSKNLASHKNHENHENSVPKWFPAILTIFLFTGLFVRAEEESSAKLAVFKNLTPRSTVRVLDGMKQNTVGNFMNYDKSCLSIRSGELSAWNIGDLCLARYGDKTNFFLPHCSGSYCNAIDSVAVDGVKIFARGGIAEATVNQADGTISCPLDHSQYQIHFKEAQENTIFCVKSRYGYYVSPVSVGALDPKGNPAGIEVTTLKTDEGVYALRMPTPPDNPASLTEPQALIAPRSEQNNVP